MILIVSKIIYFFITPFSWVLIALIIGFLAKKKNIKRKARISALAIALLFSNTFVYQETMRCWELHTYNKQELKQHDVAIVLGGMFEYDNDANRISARRGVDRIWQAIDLYKSRKVSKICIVGAHGNIFDRGLDEANQLKAQLISWGIPNVDILVETESRNTNENAKLTSALMKQSYPHFNSFVLVTSARHMKRASALFQKYDLRVTPFPTDQFSEKERNYNWDDFIIPNSDTFNGWFGL